MPLRESPGGRFRNPFVDRCFSEIAVASGNIPEPEFSVARAFNFRSIISNRSGPVGRITPRIFNFSARPTTGGSTGKAETEITDQKTVFGELKG